MKPLQYLPFPTRFNVVLAAITCHGVRNASRLILVTCGLILLVWLGSDAWAAATGYSGWRRVPELRVQQLDRAIELRRDYPLTWAATVSLRHYQLPDLENFLSQHPPMRVWIGDSTIRPANLWEPRQSQIGGLAKFVCRFGQSTTASSTLLIIFITGWRTHVEENGQESTVQHDADGLFQIQAPCRAYTPKLF